MSSTLRAGIRTLLPPAASLFGQTLRLFSPRQDLQARGAHGRTARCSRQRSPTGESAQLLPSMSPKIRAQALTTYAASSMINEAEFHQMVEEMAAHDAEREKVIKLSRDIQKNAKQAIFSLHRGALEKSQSQIEACEEVAKELSPVLEANPDLKWGSFSNSMEEYAEAVVFKTFLEEGRLLAPSEITLVTRDEYLGGVLDFTGELNRYCIAKATVRDVEEVKRCRNLVEGLMAMFLQFDFRNGSLRKKFDSLKYTLKKMENTLYELSLSGSGGLGKSNAVDNSEPLEAAEVKSAKAQKMSGPPDERDLEQ